MTLLLTMMALAWGAEPSAERTLSTGMGTPSGSTLLISA